MNRTVLRNGGTHVSAHISTLGNTHDGARDTHDDTRKPSCYGHMSVCSGAATRNAAILVNS
ncbi:hypothetical protein JS533_011810 [Bifidobacterium amazonense]|uniref:Uncharacterized protein n=1 Tax=Bifidobacterium amazonense TaxID=2809027 RepID=A0ABS9VXU6_9BIFI|nr:hypothetical protein [Bifidobacterium amazonense]MCH9276945.1 hypothetical protein [Bifidobacterium amazonense]